MKAFSEWIKRIDPLLRPHNPFAEATVTHL